MSSVYAKRAGIKRAYPVKSGKKIGAVVAVFLQDGLAIAHGDATATAKFCGVSTFSVSNKGIDGAERVEVDHLETAFSNSGDITNAEIGSNAYFASAVSLSKDSSTNSRPVAGVITEIDGNLVWVKPAVE